MSRDKSFTIIELLIVIAVIAILVGVALPRFRGMQEEGKIAQAKGELRTLQTAVESYYIHNSNTYPAEATWSTLLTGASPNIIGSAVPTDPFNGTNNYGYKIDTGSPAKYYVVWSVGPKGSTVCTGCTVSTAGTVAETAGGESCIYVTNGSPRDTQP
jgi:general secretion pathway protein G